MMLGCDPMSRIWRKELDELFEQFAGKIEKLPQMPTTQEETRRILKQKQDHDEAEAIRHLAEDQGTAMKYGIYEAWKL